MTIRNIEVMYETIEKDIFKVNKHTMEYLLKDDNNLRAVSEFFLNEDEDYDCEVDSESCYERVVYRYFKNEDKIKGFNYHGIGGLYFDDNSLEYDDEFYIFNTRYRDFEGGVYKKPFEIEVEEYNRIIWESVTG